MVGFVNSFQSLGTVDGPGVRCVVFMQGCPLRCCYCHNPETWETKGGIEYSPEDLLIKVLRFKEYIKNGGVTVSGGEPLLQWEFVTDFFRLCHENNIHTALDTSGICNVSQVEKLLEYVDLVICDIKFSNQDMYNKNCCGSLNTVLEFLKATEKKNIPLWVRHVVVENLTDSKSAVKEVYQLARKFKNLEKFELLPFKKFCLTKYEEMGIPFALKNTPQTTTYAIDNLYSYITHNQI